MAFELIYGKYYNREIECPQCQFKLNRPVEKRTDVNIAIRMIEDCFENRVDILSLVTAVSDLIPPIELIQKLFPQIKIKVYFPPNNYSYDLYNIVLSGKGKIIHLEKNFHHFWNCKMPDIVTDGGKSYTIPEKWKQ